MITTEDTIETDIRIAKKEFSKIGLVVSESKTEIWKERVHTEPLKILGMMLAGKKAQIQDRLNKELKGIIEQASTKETLTYVERRTYANSVIVGKMSYKIFGASPHGEELMEQMDKDIRRWILGRDFPNNAKMEYYYIKFPMGFGIRSLKYVYQNLCLGTVLKIVSQKIGTKQMKKNYLRWWNGFNGNPVYDASIRHYSSYMNQGLYYHIGRKIINYI